MLSFKRPRFLPQKVELDSPALGLTLFVFMVVLAFFGGGWIAG